MNEAMSDTRQALEEAFKAIYPEPYASAIFRCQRPYEDISHELDGLFPDWDKWNVVRLRFRRFLDAEAWTDAALMLVPENHRIVTLTEHVDRGGWYVKLAVHSPHKALPAVEATTLALALAQACLKARENGDG